MHPNPKGVTPSSYPERKVPFTFEKLFQKGNSRRCLRNFQHHSHARALLYCLAIFFILAGSPARSSGSEESKQSASKEFSTCWSDTLVKTVSHLADSLAKGNLLVDVAGGFNADKSPSADSRLTTPKTASLYKFTTSASISYVKYPIEARFLVESGFVLDGDFLKESVSKLVLNVDQHPGVGSEVFGFAERFSDSYMSIDDRYEVGGGAKIRMARGYTKKGESVLCPLRAATQETDSLLKEALRSAKTPRDSVLLRNKWGQLRAFRRGAEDDKELMNFVASISAALYGELERATIILKAESGADSIRKEVPTDSELRASIRPKLSLRSDPFFLDAVVFFKFKLLPVAAIDATRIESELNVGFSASKTIDLLIKFQHRFDASPPHVDDLFAHDTHWTLNWMVKVKVG